MMLWLRQCGPWLFAALFCTFSLMFFLPVSSKATNNLFYAGLALPCLIWLSWRPSALRMLRPFVIACALLWLMVALDAADWSDLKKGLYLSLLFASCLLLERRRWDMQSIFTVFGLVCLGLLLFISADWLWHWEHSGDDSRYWRFLGETINPVHFSMLITCGLIFLWVFHVSDWLERRSRLALWVGLFLLSVLILWCASVFQSRSTLLGFAAFFAGYLLYKRFVLPGILLGGVLLALLLGLGVDELLRQRGFSYRLMIWEDAWQRVAGQCGLWLGCGEDGYLFLGRFYHAHSGYVSMLYHNGLVGAAALLMFAALCFVKGLRSRWMLLALFGWGGLLTTSSGIVTTPQPLWIYFWLPTFMMLLDGRRDAVAAYFEARQAS